MAKKRTFFLVIFFGFQAVRGKKAIGLYKISYLIDKKEYRKRKIFEERIAGSKSICIFVAEK